MPSNKYMVKLQCSRGACFSVTRTREVNAKYILLLLPKSLAQVLTTNTFDHQVTSPTKRVAGAADQAAPAGVVDGPYKATDDHLEEKSVAPMGTMDQVLSMLGALSKHMHRLKVSQKEQGGKYRQRSPESIFGSAWEWGRG